MLLHITLMYIVINTYKTSQILACSRNKNYLVNNNWAHAPATYMSSNPKEG